MTVTKSPRDRRRRVRGAIVILLATITGMTCTGALVAWQLIFHPQLDDLENIDAVFVLGPITSERVALADRIADEAGGVPFIASRPGGAPCVKPENICLDAVPATTKGEAAALRELATSMGFKHPAIVTFTPHVSRARFIFHNCYGPNVSVVAPPGDLRIGDMLYQLLYQSAAAIKAAVTPCAESASAHPSAP